MDRGCSVSINACLTLPRLAPDARPSDVPGIRFEYSWGPGGGGVLTGPTSQPTGGLRGWSADRVRYKTSSSGYGSGERSSESISRYHYNAAGSSVVAATLTLTHPQLSPQSPSQSHPPIQSPATTPSGRVIQPYERRCRSTCSITLQGLKSNGRASPSGQNYPLRPFPPQEQQQRQHNLQPSLSLPLRRSSEGEAVAWNSHSKLPQLLASLTDSRCPLPAATIDPTLVAPVADSSKDAEIDEVLKDTTKDGIRKKTARKSKKKTNGKERPRTVHIDVYCTASESETESNEEEEDHGKTKQRRCNRREDHEDFDSDESNESNTSSCYTVVRKDQSAFYRNIRHIRKKNGLPQSLARTVAGGSACKPMLSYRISAQELAQAAAASAAERASSRERSCSQHRQLHQPLLLLPDEEQLFRDLTLTDTSIRSLLTNGEDSTSDFETSTNEYAGGNGDYGALRGWRSPEEERRRKMLEQRKQQWRAAKAAEGTERQTRKRDESSSKSTVSRGGSSHSLPVLNRLAVKKDSCFLNPTPLQLQVSDSVLSRHNSQRCPSIDKLLINCQPPSKLRDSFSSNVSSVPSRSCNELHLATKQHNKSPTPPTPTPLTLQVNTCWPFGVPNQQQRKKSSALTKKFGHHVGPARNPDCGCAHCLDHFSRIQSLRATGRV